MNRAKDEPVMLGLPAADVPHHFLSHLLEAVTCPFSSCMVPGGASQCSLGTCSLCLQVGNLNRDVVWDLNDSPHNFCPGHARSLTYTS